MSSINSASFASLGKFFSEYTEPQWQGWMDECLDAKSGDIQPVLPLKQVVIDSFHRGVLQGRAEGILIRAATEEEEAELERTLEHFCDQLSSPPPSWYSESSKRLLNEDGRRSARARPVPNESHHVGMIAERAMEAARATCESAARIFGDHVEEPSFWLEYNLRGMRTSSSDQTGMQARLDLPFAFPAYRKQGRYGTCRHICHNLEYKSWEIFPQSVRQQQAKLRERPVKARLVAEGSLVRLKFTYALHDDRVTSGQEIRQPWHLAQLLRIACEGAALGGLSECPTSTMCGLTGHMTIGISNDESAPAREIIVYKGRESAGSPPPWVWALALGSAKVQAARESSDAMPNLRAGDVPPAMMMPLDASEEDDVHLALLSSDITCLPSPWEKGCADSIEFAYDPSPAAKRLGCVIRSPYQLRSGWGLRPHDMTDSSAVYRVDGVNEVTANLGNLTIQRPATPVTPTPGQPSEPLTPTRKPFISRARAGIQRLAPMTPKRTKKTGERSLH